MKTASATFLVASLAASGLHAETALLYSASNKADANTIVILERDASGGFALKGEVETGGKGTGDLEIPALKKDPTHPLLNGDDPLISANAIAVVDGGKGLVVVNPGDATVSLLDRAADGSLTFNSKAAASDLFPVSAAVFGDLVAVASVGDNNGAGSIGLMQITDKGLVAVEGSRRDLQARPSTIAFTSDGEHVIVSELVTGMIDVFGIADGNLTAEPVSRAASPRDEEDRFQAIPVGFAVHGNGGDDIVGMSEARFLTPDFMLRGPVEGAEVVQTPLYSWQTGSLSTYKVTDDGQISLISGDVLTGAAVEGGEIANCWVVMSNDGSTLWAVNALSSSISSFRIRENGTAALVNDKAYKDDSEALFFSDIALSDDGSELYQLVGNRGEIMIFAVEANGNLTHKQTVGGLPELGAFGLVALSR